MADPGPSSPGTPGVHHDPADLARAASLDELQRMKLAEEIGRLRAERMKSPSRFAIASQVLVGYIALAGFFVNAYQLYQNKKHQDEQSRSDQEKWNKEFGRASQADKYRAFFETAILATDPSNPDKRLVGYALLQEFVQDPAYDRKAMVMLEESLSQELRGSPKDKLDDAHRLAVVSILTALAGTDDCRTLQRAARSVDRVTARYARTKDSDETRDVLDVYVRRLLGRAAQVCTSYKEFRAVRLPIRDTMLRNPDVLGLNNPTAAEANLLIATVLRQRCEDELSYSGASDCPDILRDYAALCGKSAMEAEERDACEVIQEATTALPSGTPTTPGASSTTGKAPTAR